MRNVARASSGREYVVTVSDDEVRISTGTLKLCKEWHIGLSSNLDHALLYKQGFVRLGAPNETIMEIQDYGSYSATRRVSVFMCVDVFDKTEEMIVELFASTRIL